MMQLIDIVEPELPAESEIIFGIDFGTTYSLISRVDKDGSIEIFCDSDGKDLIPSLVSYPQNVEKNYSSTDNNSIVIKSIKRLMGKDVIDLINNKHLSLIKDESGKIYVDVGNHNKITPIEIASEIFKKLANIVRKSSGLVVKKAVVTVPAYFDEVARKSIVHAANIAGIKVVRLLNEPTSAALAYGIDKNKETGIYVVYDLGGGTFDVSILKLYQGVFRVLSTSGDIYLGGDDFDYALVEHILKSCGYNDSDISSFSASVTINLLTQAKLIKEYLSKHEVWNSTVNIDSCEFELKISRSEFENIISSMIDRTIKIIKEAIIASNINYDDIDGIILVGGSTRIPLIYNKLRQNFDKKIFSDIDPDRLVVMGAAFQGYYLSIGSNKKTLIDVLPLSLGLETMGGIVDKIIPRNSPIPISVIKEFTNYVDGQSFMKIHVCQGEREFIEDNRSLLNFEIKIPPLPRGQVRVKVEFKVDIDGLLTITVVENTNQVREVIEVNANYGITDSQVKDMVDDSIKNFNQDMLLRELTEEKLNASRIIESVSAAINEDSDLLTESSTKEIIDAIESLKHAILGDEIGYIKHCIEILELKSKNFLEKRIGLYLRKSINSISD